jgi:hypothetical protein
MPAALGGKFSPRRIIDPYASHYFAVPTDWFDFLVWRSCLRVFAAGLLSALASALVFGGHVAPALRPASLDSSDSALTH